MVDISSKCDGMSAMVLDTIEKLSETHQPKMLIIETGASFAKMANQLDGKTIKLANDVEQRRP
jgi:hypothetical protein